jgi:hypothetical protein
MDHDGMWVGCVDARKVLADTRAGARVMLEQDLLEGVFDVRRRDRPAVVPACARREVEGIDGAAGVYRPPFGEIRTWSEIAVAQRVH